MLRRSILAAFATTLFALSVSTRSIAGNVARAHVQPIVPSDVRIRLLQARRATDTAQRETARHSSTTGAMHRFLSRRIGLGRSPMQRQLDMAHAHGEAAFAHAASAAELEAVVMRSLTAGDSQNATRAEAAATESHRAESAHRHAQAHHVAAAGREHLASSGGRFLRRAAAVAIHEHVDRAAAHTRQAQIHADHAAESVEQIGRR